MVTPELRDGIVLDLQCDLGAVLPAGMDIDPRFVQRLQHAVGRLLRYRLGAQLRLPAAARERRKWLEQRLALADAAIAAAQEVIGQCDCNMDDPPPNPKKAWHTARDAYYAARLYTKTEIRGDR